MDTVAFIGSIARGYIGDWFGFEALFLVAGLTLFAGLAIHTLVIKTAGLADWPSFPDFGAGRAETVPDRRRA
jgi:dipeptide/tripeptide permease